MMFKHRIITKLSLYLIFFIFSILLSRVYVFSKERHELKIPEEVSLIVYSNRDIYDILNIINSAKKTDFSYSISHKLFLQLEEVSPFNNQNDLIDMSDYLKEKGIPFIVSVTPFYQNAELPETKEFFRVLRYMQGNGGIILLRSFYQGKLNYNSTVSGTLPAEKSDLFNRFNDCMKLLTGNGLYPLAYEIPASSGAAEEYKEILECFSSIFIQTDDEGLLNNLKSDPFLRNRSFSATFPSSLGVDYLKEFISSLEKYGVVFSDFLNENSNVRINSIDISSEKHRISFNGSRISLKFQENASPAENAGEKPQDKEVYKLNIEIQKINRFAVIVVAVFCFLLLSLFIIGKRIDRRKFLR